MAYFLYCVYRSRGKKMIKLSSNAYETKSNQSINSTHHNPFSVSFKKSLSPELKKLNSDIFQSQTTSNIVNNTSFLNKISNVSAKIKNKVNNISFNGAKTTMKKMSENTRTGFKGIISKISSMFKSEKAVAVNNVEVLKNSQSVFELKQMLISKIA